MRTHQWDITAPATADGFTAYNTESWYTSSETSHTRTTPLPPQRHGTQTVAWTGDLPGGLPSTMDTDPLTRMLFTADSGELAVALSRRYGTYIAAGLAAECERQHLTAAQRAAALRVLASLRDIAGHGTVYDRAGRAGNAYSVFDTMTGSRDALIISPQTGALLSWEQTIVRDGSARVTAFAIYLG